MNLLSNLSPIKNRLLFLAGLLLLLLFLLPYAWLRPGEPRYQGKPISYWLKQYDQTRYVRDNRTLEASNAIYQIGPAAIPFALDRLRLQSYSFFDPPNYKNPLLRWISEARKRRNGKRVYAAGQAIHVFSILGKDGSTAIPELRRMLLNSNYTYFAAEALALLGKDALPALAEGRTNSGKFVRSVSFANLTRLLDRPDQELHQPAVLILLQTNGDPNPEMALRSLLGSLARATNVNFPDIAKNMPVIPLLTEQLSTNANATPKQREWASNVLQKTHQATINPEKL